MFVTVKRLLSFLAQPWSILEEWRVYTTIRDSGKFDPEYYLETYPDVKDAGIAPLKHYVRYGAYEGRNPCSDFNAEAYLKAHANLRDARVNPFYHYLKEGASSIPFQKKKIITVFASYSKDNHILPYVQYYLAELAKYSNIIFVSDNDVSGDELAKIKPYILSAICGRHGEYDFGSYKRGLAYAESAGLLERCDGLLLCNDSCVGPLYDLSIVFDEMDKRKVDFWGLTFNEFKKPHLQTYFVYFSKKVFSHDAFRKFFQGVQKKDNVQQVVLAYEVEMTSRLAAAGFKWSSFITGNPVEYYNQKRIIGPETQPLFTMSMGSPLVKRKGLLRAQCNIDGIQRTIKEIKSRNYELYNICMNEEDIAKFMQNENVSFSLIMPTYNRSHCVDRAIESVLQQRHSNYELIIVDDYSKDGTEQLIRQKYADALASGLIRFLRNKNEKGVCEARNYGLQHAKHEWIGYVDSDNTIRPNFLTCFAEAILEYPGSRTFYAEFCKKQDGVIVGREFDHDRINAGNFIDLGVFVHHRSCFEEIGGFDTSLKRLVDWDLVLRYTRLAPPVFIKSILMDYNNADDPNRISRRESEFAARFAIIKKHNLRPTVTVAIPTYNHEKFIAETIDSALAQQGNYEIEIIVADDGSTDKTPEIVEKYVKKYPFKVRAIGDGVNRGISANFRRCFEEANGEFIAILEGDDLWTDPYKLNKQIEFLRMNEHTPMVFSKILVRNDIRGTESTLARQDKLNSEFLTGRDFLNDSSMNLIANFSSCLFRTKLMKQLPDRLFSERFNEIALAFYLERIAPIGFLDEVMSIYRQHAQGVWTGSDEMHQLQSAIKVREMVRDVADPAYRNEIQKIIDRKTQELSSLLKAS